VVVKKRQKTKNSRKAGLSREKGRGKICNFRKKKSTGGIGKKKRAPGRRSKKLSQKQ